MFSTWTVQSPPPGRCIDAKALDALLDTPTAQSPARGMLDFINSFVPVDYLSLVEYAGPLPSQVDGRTHGTNLPDITRLCFSRYKGCYHRFDEVTRLAQHVQKDTGSSGEVTVLHYAASDIPDLNWRRDIFEQCHLTGRVSLLYAPLAGTSFVINLYRDEISGEFQLGEIEHLIAIAPILRKVHQATLHAQRETLSDNARQALVVQALAQRAPQLSPRERQVCAGIARGLSVDGIAAEIGVAATTVQTLRKRAYLKLGIHGRQQLLRLAH